MNQISRQAHSKAVKQIQDFLQKSHLYKSLVFDIRQQHPGMGLRSIYEMMQPEGIGRDAFIEFGVQNGLMVYPKPTIPKTTFAHPSAKYPNLLKDMKFTDVNQIWSSDITYCRLGNQWYYIVLIMDVYSRKVLGYSVADNMRADNNEYALQMAFDQRGIENYLQGLIHHSDRGGQYISDIYVRLLNKHGVRISMCTEVLENSHIERLNGTIKNYYLNHWYHNTFDELKRNLDKAIKNYNNRPHDSLGKKSPNEFEDYVKELPVEDRPILKIFCYTQNNYAKDPNQLVLEF